jgi:EthD domain
MKFFTLISAAAGQDRQAFRQWFLKEHAPMVLEQARGLQRYIVDLVDVKPPRAENAGFVAPEVEPPYDVITEMWFGSPDDFKDRARLYGSASAAAAVEKHLSAKAGQIHSYRVSEFMEKDVKVLKAGERSPGFKSVIPIQWLPHLSIDDGRRGWQVHGTIALRTHTGMSKYVRNLVEEVVTDGAPYYPGIGELHFNSDDDMRYGLFPTPHSLEVISFDTKRWLGPVAQHYSSEWVLKA